jgi:DNA invertase Pin-like site-specific DNA recombinase
MTNALVWALVLLMLPLHLLLWATESKGTTVRRLRRQGLTWKSIANRLGCSPTTARRWATN